MPSLRNNALLILVMTGLLFSGFRVAAQSASETKPESAAGFRIAGIIVRKTDGHPLSGARVALASTKDRQKPQSVTTSDDGKFEFNGVPAGKYALSGAKRGYIPAGYDQHDQFSTAIVTGAGLDTEHLVLKLDSDSVISGKVLDDVGDPVRDATIALYRDYHFEGAYRIQKFRGAQTNDLGEFEIPNLTPGTYFISASAQPWYAVRPPSGLGRPLDGFDPALDVTYPTTYSGDVTDAEGATPISVRGGEHLQVDVHLNPVPSLHVIVHVPTSGNNQFPFPQFEQTGFGGSTPVERTENRMITPGTWEISGIPAGKYNVRLEGQNSAGQINGVNIDGSTQELDTSTAELMCSVKVSVSYLDATPTDSHGVMLQSDSSRFNAGRLLDAKNEAQFENLIPGRYEVFLFGGGARFSVGRLQAEGATVAGHTVTLTSGASATLLVSAMKGTAEIEGVAKRSGKPVAGAMVVLVPRDPGGNHDLFRRDQSDLDGTFVFHNVIPGSYTAVAIENGWDLDWAVPELILPYAKRGVPVQVSDKPGQNLSLSGPVEVQQK